MGKKGRFLEELLTPLIQGGYIVRTTQQSEINGCTRSYDVHTLGQKGLDLANAFGKAISGMVKFPAPQQMLELERAEEEKRLALHKELKDNGVDLARIPKEELDDGDGPMIRSAKVWTRTIAHYRSNENTAARADALEKLLEGIVAWRDRVAIELRLAPFHVLPDHIARNVAYVRPKVVEALEQCGARVRSGELLALISDLTEKYGLTANAIDGGQAAEGDADGAEAGDQECCIKLPSGDFTPAGKWSHAVYKPGKAGMPPWEQSLIRFQKGEHPEAIAVGQASGKPVTAATVIGHLQEALVQGRAVNIGRVAQVAALPKKGEWDKMEHGAVVGQLDVTVPDFKAKDLLRAILGEQVDADHTTKPEDQKAVESAWYSKIRWYQSLKRAAFPVAFD